MSAKVNNLFVEKKEKVAEKDFEAFWNQQQCCNIDPTFSLDTGACVPKGKYGEALQVLYNTKAMLKSLTLIAKYWWHDIPFSKSTQDSNLECTRTSSFMIKAIAYMW